MNITHNRVPLRDNEGKFSKKKGLKLGMIAAGLLIIGTGALGWVDSQNKIDAVALMLPEMAHADVVNLTMTQKVEALKESILDRLAKCESGGKREEDGITVLDTNDVGSYGSFQWQKKSVMYYYEKMTGDKINGRDAIILAMTPDKARDLARYVIFETDAGVAKDWVNCSRNGGLQAEVDIVKRLTR